MTALKVNRPQNSAGAIERAGLDQLAARAYRARWMSPERYAYLQQHYPFNPSPEALQAGFFSLPGASVAWRVVVSWCVQHGLRRPRTTQRMEALSSVVGRPRSERYERACLRCRGRFVAPSRFVRLCDRCGKYAETMGSAIE